MPHPLHQRAERRTGAGEAGFFGPGAPPQLSINSGRVVIDLSDGSILSQRGQSEDLCAQLAHP